MEKASYRILAVKIFPAMAMAMSIYRTLYSRQMVCHKTCFPNCIEATKYSKKYKCKYNFASWYEGAGGRGGVVEFAELKLLSSIYSGQQPASAGPPAFVSLSASQNAALKSEIIYSQLSKLCPCFNMHIIPMNS